MARHNRHRKQTTTVIHRRAASAAVTAGIGLGIPLTASGTASAADTTAWDTIAECESNGRWNLPYGHASSTGGLQIQKPTWDDYGGREFTAYPHQATKAQQIAVAERILKGQGPKAWTCNAKTGNPLGALVGKDTGRDAAPRQAPAPDTAAERTSSKPATKASGKTADKASGAYEVRSGDTLSGIAERHGAGSGAGNWRPLYAENSSVIGADPNLIRPGQNLRLPAPAGAPAQSQAAAARADGRGAERAPAAERDGSSRVSPIAGTQGTGYGRASAGYTLGHHTGSDYAVPHGTQVRAAAAGKVVASDSASSYGVNVRIQHADGTYTVYAHLSGKVVQVGTQVPAGRLIGYVGSTGNSTGPHLHFEVRSGPDFRAGGFLDPQAWLARA